MKKNLKIIALVLILFFSTTPFVSAKKFISGPHPVKKWVGPNPSNDFNFYLNATARSNIISGGSTVSYTFKDINFDQITAGTVDHEADITNTSLPSGAFGTFSSANTSIATVDSSGKITRVSDGVARINFTATPTSGKYLKKQIAYSVFRTSGEVVNSFNSYVAGSLGKYLYDNIDSRIAAVTASDATTKLWSTEDHTTPTYVWNVNFWGYGTDLTPIVVWNSYTDCCAPGDFERRAGVLISPRHFAYANHYTFPNGTTVRFVKQDGTVVMRTVTNQAQVGTTDIQIGLLDSDVPAGIGFAKVLPANYTTYLPSLTSTTTVPAMSLLGGAYSVPDTDKQGYLRELNVSGTSMYFTAPTVAHRLTFYGRDVTVGDSGNPNFLIINNGLVLLNTNSSFGGFGPDYAQNITAINSTMSTLGGGYTLTTVDLSAYNTY